MIVFLAFGLTLQTAVFLLGAFAWLRSMAYTYAEAAAGAVVIVFITLSLIHQVGFYFGYPLFAVFIEMTAMAAIVFLGYRRLGRSYKKPNAMIRLMRQELFPVAIIAIAWLAMLAFAAKGWFDTSRSPELRIWPLLADGSMTTGFFRMDAIEPLTPINSTALFYHSTRFGFAPGACGFGVLAYMAVGFSTYALARRYAWPPMALTVTLLVLSIPRLVFLGMAPSAELISTAAIIFAMVLVYRLLEQHRPVDLRLLLCSVLYAIGANPMSIALVPVFSILLGVMMIRRHGMASLWEIIADRPMITGLLVLPMLVLAQVPVFVMNHINGHPLLGNDIAFESGGIIGATANLVRFFFISCDPIEPLQAMLVWLVGLDLKALLMGLYHTVMAIFPGQADMADAFTLHFSSRGGFGFGPFVIILLLPAMIHALIRGPRRLKSVSLAWLGYLYIAALVLAWQPDNLFILCPLYAANGFMVAFSLPAWRLRRRGMRLLQVDFALLMAWTLVSCW